MVHVYKKGTVSLIQGAVLWRNNRQQERSCWAVDARRSLALPHSPRRDFSGERRRLISLTVAGMSIPLVSRIMLCEVVLTFKSANTQIKKATDLY